MAHTTDSGLAYSDGSQWVLPFARRRPFAYGNIAGTNTAALTDPSGANAFLGGTFRGPRMVVLQGPTSQIQFLFRNFDSNDLPGFTIYTFGCTIEVGTDQTTSAKYPLTFNGRLLATLDPGGMIWSDPVNLDVVAGDVIFPRTYLTVPATGTGYGSTFVTTSALGEGYDVSDTSPPDKRATGTITTRNSLHGFGPIIAKGISWGPRLPAIGLIGDSIMNGTGDTLISQIFRGGWASRGINGRVPYAHASRSGATASGATFCYRGRAHLELCDHVITGYGVNDMDDSLATVQANFIAIWRSLRAMGAKVWQTTVTPRTTSTDGFVTTTNQTVSVNQSKRVALNDWLRDGAPLNAAALTPVATGTVGAPRAGDTIHPLYSYLDVADQVESARNSGIYKASHTADGIHPNSTGHIAMSAVLADLSAFGYQP